MVDRTEGAAAYAAVQMLSAEVNRGGIRQKGIAEAIGREHGYLVNQIVYGIALGVIAKCRFAIHSDGHIASCGEVMYPIASGPNPSRGTAEWAREQAARDDHPYHDGELNCKAVRGALVTLNVDDGDWRRPTCWIWS